jgi:hypothetical protein
MVENPPDEIRQKFYRFLNQFISNSFISRFSSLAKTRVSVEQMFGIWKNRFLCLKGSSTPGRGPIRFRNPAISATLIQACGILQNFIMDERTPNENDDRVFLAAYDADIERAKKELAKKKPKVLDQNLEAEDDDYTAFKLTDRLQKQINHFIRYNKL